MFEKNISSNPNQVKHSQKKVMTGIGSSASKVKLSIDNLNLKKPITTENIEAGKGVNKKTVDHILKNNYSVKNPYSVRCVDDRTPENLEYGIYAAGGTQGVLKIIFSILNKYNKEFDKEEIRNIFVDMIGGEENYYYHSDDHCIKEEGACGCGDMNLAMNKDHSSFLTESDKEFFKQKRSENKDKMEVLEGSHNAKGVILIDDKNISITPKGLNGGYFIYNQKAVQNLLKEFVFKINENSSLDIDVNNVLRELDEETLSTFGTLGANAPHYRLKMKGNKYVVEHDGSVQEVKAHYYMKD